MKSPYNGTCSAARSLIVGLALVVVGAHEAGAHHSPSNCDANKLQLSTQQIPATTLTQDQTVKYAVSVVNPGMGTGTACDVSNLRVTVTCPGPDGLPTGTTTVLA